MLNFLERIESWLWPAPPNSDKAILRKLRPFLRKQESLMEFHARTLLNRDELAHVLTREQIAARIATAEANSKDEAAPPMFVPPKLYDHGVHQQAHPQPKPHNVEFVGTDGDTTGVFYERADPSREMFF